MNRSKAGRRGNRSPIAVVVLVVSCLTLTACSQTGEQQADSGSIDRRALVTRHFPGVQAPDAFSPFTVGNGEFAFTADITGLQTFPEYYEESIPLGTMSQWGWHSEENPRAYTPEQTLELYDAGGRPVPYASQQFSDAGQWLRANPHRLHLGQVGLVINDEHGQSLALSDLHAIDQQLDLWHGVLHSRFEVLGQKVAVATAVHPELDMVAAQIDTPLLASGQVQVKLDFPYGSQSWGKTTADWSQPERHVTEVVRQGEGFALLHRRLDADSYYVQVYWDGEARLSRGDHHQFRLVSTEPRLAVTVLYSAEEPELANPPAEQTLAESRRHWSAFWQSGAAIDFSGTDDPRAHELERRMVLSRYLTAIQTAGSLPPAETGLTYNSWHGKFHLEMHWWHGVHYVLWGRPELFEKSLPWYTDVAIHQARKKAQRQGYKGVRWPKMVGPEAVDSASTIGVFLVWQQPHPIYYAELLYQYYDRDPAVLAGYSERVFATADFMADYAIHEPDRDRYRLGPPLIPGQEIYAPEEAYNPTFELAYWRYGLSLAQKWRQRQGLEPDAHWAQVLEKLSDYPLHNGKYQNAENALGTFDDARHRRDHPTMLGAYGILPGDGIDPEAMTDTLHAVMDSWNWLHTWGWDYPMIAMTAARLGHPDIAVDALLLEVQKNRYLNNGHNYQDENLTIYLPGNGALLTALAMMAAGWDGGPETQAPGFPNDWTVRHEGLMPLL